MGTKVKIAIGIGFVLAGVVIIYITKPFPFLKKAYILKYAKEINKVDLITFR